MNKKIMIWVSPRHGFLIKVDDGDRGISEHIEGEFLPLFGLKLWGDQWKDKLWSEILESYSGNIFS